MPKLIEYSVTSMVRVRNFLFISSLTVAMWLAWSVLLTGVTHAAPATYTVTNTNDSGAGSLRAAIVAANNNGSNDTETDSIEFNIPGNEVHTINLDSALPDIVGNVDINGYSQPGSVQNTAVSPQPMNSVIKIEVNFAGNSAIGFNFTHVLNNPDDIYNSTIRGLSAYGTTEAVLTGRDPGYGNEGHFVTVKGNYFNVDATGLHMPNMSSEALDKTAIIAVLMVVGGSSPADRNILAGNGSYGAAAIYATGRASNITGNYIGLGRDGTTDLGGKVGIEINSYANVVGGPTAAHKNVISGNSLAGIIMRYGWHNYIQGNYVGTNWQGEVANSISNGVGVVVTHDAYSNLVGGANDGEGNVIAGVSGAGISTVLFDYPVGSNTPQGNAFLRNNIYSIGTFDFPGFGDSNLGIDLNGPEVSDMQGPNPNDPGDADTGPNGLINTPVLHSALQVDDELTVNYDLDVSGAIEQSGYRVEFYANDGRSVFGNGPGEVFVGAVDDVTPGNNLTASFSVAGDLAYKSLTATVTTMGLSEGDAESGDPTGFGSTSEFSYNVLVATAADQDADGVPDTIEDGAPNNGDGNYDGVADKSQPTITSYILTNSEATYATLMTEGCSENGTVSSLSLSSLQVVDNGYVYPYGLVDFTLNCSRGDAVDITLFIHDDAGSPANFFSRKYNRETQSFIALDSASLTQHTQGGRAFLKLQYSVTDGGPLDDDGSANGVIVDPVGLALNTHSAGEADTNLAETGQSVFTAAFVIGLMLLAGFGLYRSYSKS